MDMTCVLPTPRTLRARSVPPRALSRQNGSQPDAPFGGHWGALRLSLSCCLTRSFSRFFSRYDPHGRSTLFSTTLPGGRLSGGDPSSLLSLRGWAAETAVSDLAALALAERSSLSGMKCICLLSLVSPHMRPRMSRILESAPEDAHAAVSSLACLGGGR